MDKVLSFVCLEVTNGRFAKGKTIVATGLEVKVGDMVRYRNEDKDEEVTGEALAVIAVTENSEPYNWLQVASTFETKTVVKVWHLSDTVQSSE